MEKFSKELLEGLLSKYQRSVLSKNGSAKNISIKYNFDNKIFKDYKDYRQVGTIEAQLKYLEDNKFIKIQKDRNDNILSVSLEVSEIENIYKLLNIENPAKILTNILEYLKSFNATGVARDFIKEEIEYIQSNFKYHKQLYDNVDELHNLLKCLNEIQKIKDEIMERDFSVRLFNDSKIFALRYKTKTINILKQYKSELKDFSDEEVLKEFNLIKNSSYVLVKNNLNFQINKQIINLNKFGFEFSLSDSMIKDMKILPSNFESVITVENLTSFKTLKDKNSVVIFLSGFNSHTKQMLLKKIYEKYSNKKYLHFGDIDVGGFRIFNHLKYSTKIPFEPYRMGISELKGNKTHLKQLTSNDIKNLHSLKNDSQYDLFKEEIDYMLENNVKLEQEVLDETL